ncbi:hypothetical protein SAMN05421630_101951 [Prauserella marina]|uniref:Uncharacterized protein n=1 Tax=Prauserella marina TaxID=530584 RepID=A0A1G6JZZ2_9PSEU|nr:hypothetical protein DES30_101386 [Prauserella marina]SDC24287.1 hypothetical protein SAMN05421630_101951 [Prauserella marina]
MGYGIAGLDGCHPEKLGLSEHTFTLSTSNVNI